MQLKNTLSIVFLLITFQLFSQDNLYSYLTIPKELKKNANAVVRLNDVNVTLKSFSEMIIHKKRIITVLNKQGNDNVGAYLHYDNNVKIKVLEVLIFDAFGKQIKKIKKNDFKDVSAVDGGTLYSDSRVKYLEYTPIAYPYTVEFIYETSTENTAFIPSFYPINDYFVSVQSSSYMLNYSYGLTIRKKENNTNEASIVAEVKEGKLYYKIKNFNAKKPEEHGPSFNEIVPKVLFASNQFTLEGVSAQVENWNDFGKWMYQDLIKDTDDLPAGTIEMIQNLVKNEKDDISKAKKVYQYVQDKVRYISVQVGIGGWKPFNASEVDRLSYGDCKALTNYTMSLLKAVNVESNYTVVFAGKSQRSIEKDFVSMQGNHVILSIPTENETLWLECTSQKTPFGFIGDFTDDRDVLVITPEGGKIKQTKKYTTNESTQFIKGTYKLESDGNIEVKVNIVSRGIQYDDKYLKETKTEGELKKHYKNHWDYINNISMVKMDIINDREQIEFNEDIEFNASNYSIISGERMLVTVNALNRNTYVPDRYRNRRLLLKIRRGFKDVDEVEITLPEGYKVESLPNNKTIETKFGVYKMSIVNKDENTLIYKREFVLNDGEFPKEDYAAFRTFYKDIAKQDNAKLSLIKSL